MVELVPAAERGDIATVQAYIAKGVDLDLRDEVRFSIYQKWYFFFFQPSQYLALIIILIIITSKSYFKYRTVILIAQQSASVYLFIDNFYFLYSRWNAQP